MTKYTVLAVFSSFTTLLFVVWMCLMIGLPRTDTIINIANLLNLFDTFSDVVTVTLTFSFATTGYSKICGIFHDGLLKLCGNKGTDDRLSQQLELNVIGGTSSKMEDSNTNTNTVIDVSSKGEGMLPTPAGNVNVSTTDTITGSNASGMVFVIS